MITSDAPLIRSDYETGLFTKQALAEKYHVHPDTITNVLTRCEDQDVYRTCGMNPSRKDMLQRPESTLNFLVFGLDFRAHHIPRLDSSWDT